MRIKPQSTIYMAGGFRSNWQERFRKLEHFKFIDPSQHGLRDPAEYTQWDLDAIQRSDVLLAYMERDNPGGYALALEIGYAKALGKTIILVEDPGQPERSRYFEMVRQVSDYCFDSPDRCVEFLEELAYTSAQ